MHGGNAKAKAADESRGIGFPRLYDLLILLLTRGRDAAYRARLLDLAAVAPGERLLDIGCGTGTQAVAAWRRVQPGGSIAGVDLSENMLAVARRKARRARADIVFRDADAASLPFTDASFDLVTVTTVMHMVPETKRLAALREASRVLRPGGRLLLVDYAGSLASRTHLSAKHGPHGSFDLDFWRAPLAAEGFGDVSQGPLGWLDLHFLRGVKKVPYSKSSPG